MKEFHHLCSQLVTLSWSERSQIVNLEEIWAAGAVLECEAGVPPGIQAQIQWDGVLLAGRIAEATEHDFGWRVEMEFSPLTPWSPETAVPAHALKI